MATRASRAIAPFSSHRDGARVRGVPKADQTIFQATPAGIAAMAGLMFDMTHPALGRDKINFEPPDIGIAGTRPRSLEARFWRPGSIAFWGDDLDGLHFPPFR